MTLPEALKKDEKITLTFKYGNKEGEFGPGVSFVKKNESISQENSLFYTQFEPIYARSFIPIQDTPEVRFTWKAEIVEAKGLEDHKIFMSGEKINDTTFE